MENNRYGYQCGCCCGDSTNEVVRDCIIVPPQAPKVSVPAVDSNGVLQFVDVELESLSRVLYIRRTQRTQAQEENNQQKQCPVEKTTACPATHTQLHTHKHT
eukprot:GHVR01004409.1.p1 GENE.GHVR01004409.1~~GHVR01004409.1.p1  ORF type:complete len:113 (+),score=43.49 GHVR01004409.1:36-341(+)